MKALLLEKELKTIVGCQKIINVWQYRQRNIWFAIQALINANKKSFLEFKKLFNLSENEQNEQLDILGFMSTPWSKRMCKLIFCFDKITTEIEKIGEIRMHLQIEYFADNGKIFEPDGFLYSGFIGQKSITECKNKKLIY